MICILSSGLRLSFPPKGSFLASGCFKPERFAHPVQNAAIFCSCGLNKLEVNFSCQSLVGSLPHIPNTGTQLILVYAQNLLLFLFLHVQTKERFLLVTFQGVLKY